jgi:beta-mannosidase
MPQPLTTHELATGWEFKQTHDKSPGAWLGAKNVPTNVHLDLLEHGM